MAKKHYTYTTRDMFYDYRRKYKGDSGLLNRVEWNEVVDLIIEKIKWGVLQERRFYKPRGAIGVIRMKKFSKDANKYKSIDQSKDYFFLGWEKRKPLARKFKNRPLYHLKTLRYFSYEIKDHISDLENDPYKRNYNVLA